MKKTVLFFLPVILLFVAVILLEEKTLTRNIKFSKSDYVSSSYLIFPGNLSEKAKVALDGYAYKTLLHPDGSSDVELIPQKKDYHYFKLVVKPGYKLYFLDQDVQDTKISEDTFNDDRPILVDSQDNLIEIF